MAHSTYPDGIDPAHAEPRGGAWRRWIAVLLLAAIMLAALLGAFGGGKARPVIVESGAARLEIRTPRVIRNGEFFETHIRVTARAPVAKAVVAIDAGLWRDMTINTMIPAAGEESFKDGAFEFDFGPLKAGETLAIKIDGQINPPLLAGTRGRIALFDGERELATVPLAITVLP
ncbi:MULTISPECIES: hypothetical protein [unclassified Sphingomonas]|uniref:hypothetical protein n=1 Tax=unclassified Sphingomonas TaxID=196159 RepID=UPI00215196B2|nr:MULTISPECIES: hypothetical protein [unclassified Sphingomonas]MCR5870338.1 hypothetical protein [Sphingomonas sp. J344]UUX97978.1 hypothetical protein LRS08_10000 [Sphingomonas sp. J315]